VHLDQARFVLVCDDVRTPTASRRRRPTALSDFLRLAWENGHKVDESNAHLTSGVDRRDAYAKDRKSRLRRKRSIWFLLCFALWVLSVVPLARESMHSREGAGAVAVYLAVGAITLAVAAVIRGIYVLLTKRNLWWSPWVFVLAAVVAISVYLVQSSGPGGLISAPSTRVE